MVRSWSATVSLCLLLGAFGTVLGAVDDKKDTKQDACKAHVGDKYYDLNPLRSKFVLTHAHPLYCVHFRYNFLPRVLTRRLLSLGKIIMFRLRSENGTLRSTYVDLLSQSYGLSQTPKPQKLLDSTTALILTCQLGK